MLLIELWETFLLQMDTEEEPPLRAPQQGSGSGTDRIGDTDRIDDPSSAGQSHDDRPVGATPTDVALEQDS